MDPTEQVATVLRKHGWYFIGNLGVPGMPDRRGYKCPCGWSTGDPDEPGFEDPHAHVAQAVIDALQLTEEMRYGVHAPPEHRLVGPWVEGER